VGFRGTHLTFQMMNAIIEIKSKEYVCMVEMGRKR
jgi:hypothetical protein